MKTTRLALLAALSLYACTSPSGDAAPADTAGDAIIDGVGADALASADVASGSDIPFIDVFVDVDPGGPFDAVEGGYTQGGLLGTYRSLDAEGSPDEVIVTRLDPAVDFVLSDPSFASVAGGEPFAARWSGALYAAQDGDYVLRVASGGGAVVLLHGTPVIDLLFPGAFVTTHRRVTLKKGWHPIEVIHQHDPAQNLLRLLIEPPGEPERPLGPEDLGYASSPPAEGGVPQVVAIDAGEPGPFGAKLVVTTSVPAVVSATVEGPAGALAPGTVDSEPGMYSTQHILPVSLDQITTYEVSATGVDLWGRPLASLAFTFTTPEDGDYTPGAILGSYYEGTSFDTLRMQRLDPGINLPDAADGKANGSFQATIPTNGFSVRWEGALLVEEPGDYVLHVGADDGQRLYLDGLMVADNWMDHGASYVDAPLTLAKGWHPLVVEMYENGGAAQAKLEWEGPGIERQVVPASAVGVVWPADDGVLPEITTFEVEPAGPVQAMLRFEATELCTGTVTWSLGDVKGQADLGPAASGTARRLTGLPAGEGVAIKLALEDLYGNPVETAPVEVTIEEPAPPPDPDAGSSDAAGPDATADAGVADAEVSSDAAIDAIDAIEATDAIDDGVGADAVITEDAAPSWDSASPDSSADTTSNDTSAPDDAEPSVDAAAPDATSSSDAAAVSD